MSDLASATADTTALTPYRGRNVHRVEVKITKAGDGLSQSLGIGPMELEMGDEVYILMKAVVGPHKHKVMTGYKPEEKDAPLALEMEFVAQTVTIVDEALAGKPIDEQRERLRIAKDEAKGVSSLPGTIGTGKPGDGWDEEDAEVSNVHQFPSTAAPADTCVCADVRDEHEGNGNGPCLVDGCECVYFEAVDPGDDEIGDPDNTVTTDEVMTVTSVDGVDAVPSEDEDLVDHDLPGVGDPPTPAEGLDEDEHAALDAAALATLNGGPDPTDVADGDGDVPAETEAETPPPARKARARKSTT